MRLKARDAEGREGRSGVTTRLAVLKARNGAFPSSGEPGGCLGPDQSGVFTNSGDHPQADQGAVFADRNQVTLTQMRLMYKRAFEKITTIRFQITADSTPLTALQLSG